MVNQIMPTYEKQKTTFPMGKYQQKIIKHLNIMVGTDKQFIDLTLTIQNTRKKNDNFY